MYTWREGIGCLCGGAEEVGPGLKYYGGNCGGDGRETGGEDPMLLG